jgi:hypothetical protein
LGKSSLPPLLSGEMHETLGMMEGERFMPTVLLSEMTPRGGIPANPTKFERILRTSGNYTFCSRGSIHPYDDSRVFEIVWLATLRNVAGGKKEAPLYKAWTKRASLAFFAIFTNLASSVISLMDSRSARAKYRQSYTGWSNCTARAKALLANSEEGTI